MTVQSPQASVAQDKPNGVVGTWNLASVYMEDMETHERKEPWGRKPNGRLVLTAAGDWIVVQTAEGRQPPQSDDDRCAAFRSMLAYSGKYRVEGRKIVIKVDIAWDESWTGRDEVRFFELAGDLLHIKVEPKSYANFGGRIMQSVLTWQRAG